MKDYFCDCSHGTVSIWYFCHCSFLEQSCSVCFVIAVGKPNSISGSSDNMLKYIDIYTYTYIYVKPHILLISI